MGARLEPTKVSDESTFCLQCWRARGKLMVGLLQRRDARFTQPWATGHEGQPGVSLTREVQQREHIQYRPD
jgi:hypothetical protein